MASKYDERCNERADEQPGEVHDVDDLPPEELAAYRAWCDEVAASSLAYQMAHPVDLDDNIPF
jgi:hypothetical protein